MLLMHVTKDGSCAYCDANVKKCAEESCQEFFHPKHDGHKYCKKRCNMRHRRREEKLKNGIVLDAVKCKEDSCQVLFRPRHGNHECCSKKCNTKKRKADLKLKITTLSPAPL